MNLAINSKVKGINIIGTGVCLHPIWINELKINLIEYSNGMFYNPKILDVYFVLQSEIEAIWKIDSTFKKVHFILLFPNFEKIEESIRFLSKFGNLALEGGPKIFTSAEKLIFGLKSLAIECLLFLTSSWLITITNYITFT